MKRALTVEITATVVMDNYNDELLSPILAKALKKYSKLPDVIEGVVKKNNTTTIMVDDLPVLITNTYRNDYDPPISSVDEFVDSEAMSGRVEL